MSYNKEVFEKIYEKPNVCWTNKNPPEELVNLIDSGKIKPCKVLDVGCGEGLYSIYLAKRGFDVVGIDFSERAIEHAKKNAREEGVKIKFIQIDIKNLEKLNDKFDFVFEWALLHCITIPKQRKTYPKKICKLLNEGGKYFSICFNEEQFKLISEGSREELGSKLYFSSFDELKKLFNPYFRMIESKVHENVISGKRFIWNYFFMEKKLGS